MHGKFNVLASSNPSTALCNDGRADLQHCHHESGSSWGHSLPSGPLCTRQFTMPSLSQAGMFPAGKSRFGKQKRTCRSEGHALKGEAIGDVCILYVTDDAKGEEPSTSSTSASAEQAQNVNKHQHPHLDT